jgi:hypothetical protein
MKLRIKGNSLRLRISRSELVRLLAGDKIEDTIHFAVAPEAKLTYTLHLGTQPAPVTVQYEAQTLRVILCQDHALTFGQESEVGVYQTIEIGPSGPLDVIIEKDFACLDRSDEENQDTFANPHAGSTC